MKYGYARVSTDGQSVTAQVAALRKHGAGKVFRQVASGATLAAITAKKPRSVRSPTPGRTPPRRTAA